MTISKQEMEDVLRDAAKRGYFQGSGGSAPSGSPPSSSSKSVTDEAAYKAAEKAAAVLGITAEEAYRGFKKVSDQSFTLADASESAGKIFREMGGPLGEAAATVIGDLGTYGQQTVDKWREVSKFGASFGNDAIGFRAGAAQTRMSFEEYTNFLSKNKESLIGLGGSVTESARSFNKFSKDFMDTDTADKMRSMGYTTEELNNVLAGTMASQRLVNLNNKEANGIAMRSAADLATQMDAVAKITGKSRQEQEDAMKVRATDAQYQAMEKLSLMGLSEKEKAARAAAIESMKTSAASLGPSVEGVVKEMATGGVRSKEAGEMMAALGPAGKQLQDAVNASKNAKTEDDKIRADRLMKEAEAAVIAQQNSKGYLEAQMLGIGAFKTGAESTMGYSKSMDGNLKEMNEARAKAGEKLLDLANPADAKKVKEYMDQRVKNEQAGKDADGVNKNKGAETTDAIVKFESRAKDAGAAINANLVAPLNEALGKNIRAYNEKNEGKELFGNVKDGKSARARWEEPIGGLTKTFLGDGQAAQPTKIKDPKTGKDLSVPDSVGMNRQKAGVTDSLGSLGQMMVTELNVTGKFNPGVGRSKGSLGETGNLFENFGQGTLAMLHGKESVVTEDQMKNLMKGSQGISLENIANNFKTSISAMPSMSGLGQTKDTSQSSPTMNNLKKSSSGLAGMGNGVEGVAATATATGTGSSDMGASGKEKSITDLDDKLDQLNKTMMQLVVISSQTAENSGKQIKATKGLGGNLFA